MYLAFLDGLDALVEHYIPLAREYPITPLLILLILVLPAIVTLYGMSRKRKP